MIARLLTTFRRIHYNYKEYKDNSKHRMVESNEMLRVIINMQIYLRSMESMASSLNYKELEDSLIKLINMSTMLITITPYNQANEYQKDQTVNDNFHDEYRNMIATLGFYYEKVRVRANMGIDEELEDYTGK